MKTVRSGDWFGCGKKITQASWSGFLKARADYWKAKDCEKGADMDIEKLIETETARERALYERVKAAEREMEPFKRRYETLRGEWSEAYNQVKTLTKMRELLEAHTAETSADAAVLDADRRALDDGAVYRVKPSGELERLP